MVEVGQYPCAAHPAALASELSELYGPGLKYIRKGLVVRRVQLAPGLVLARSAGVAAAAVAEPKAAAAGLRAKRAVTPPTPIALILYLALPGRSRVISSFLLCSMNLCKRAVLFWVRHRSAAGWADSACRWLRRSTFWGCGGSLWRRSQRLAGWCTALTTANPRQSQPRPPARCSGVSVPASASAQTSRCLCRHGFTRRPLGARTATTCWAAGSCCRRPVSQQPSHPTNIRSPSCFCALSSPNTVAGSGPDTDGGGWQGVVRPEMLLGGLGVLPVQPADLPEFDGWSTVSTRVE